MVLISLASFSFSSLALQLEKELEVLLYPRSAPLFYPSFPQYFPSLLFFHAFLPPLSSFIFPILLIFALCNLPPCPSVSFLESEMIQ